jgi:hypothetical protein
MEVFTGKKQFPVMVQEGNLALAGSVQGQGGLRKIPCRFGLILFSIFV